MAPRLARARRLRLRAGRRVVGGMGGPRTHTAACPRHRAASARSHGCQPGGCARSRGWHAFARRTGRGPRHAPGVAAGWRLAARRGGPARWRGVARPVKAGEALQAALLSYPEQTPALTEQLEAGQGAITLPLQELPGLSAAARPGDLVDLYVSFTHRQRQLTMPLLAGSKVLALDPADAQEGVHHHPAGVGPGGGAPGRRAARGHAYRGAAARRRTGPGAGSGFRSAVGPRGRRSAGPAGHAARRRAPGGSARALRRSARRASGGVARR